jgi:hypothetical protein
MIRRFWFKSKLSHLLNVFFGPAKRIGAGLSTFGVSRALVYNKYRHNFIFRTSNSVHVIYSRGVLGLPDKALKVTEKAVRNGILKAAEAAEALAESNLSKSSKPLENLNDGVNKTKLSSIYTDATDKNFIRKKIILPEGAKRGFKISTFMDTKVHEYIVTKHAIAAIIAAGGFGTYECYEFFTNDLLDLEEPFDTDFNKILKKASENKNSSISSLYRHAAYVREEKDDIDSLIKKLEHFKYYRITIFDFDFTYISLKKMRKREERFDNYIARKMDQVRTSHCRSDFNKSDYLKQLETLMHKQDAPDKLIEK